MIKHRFDEKIYCNIKKESKAFLKLNVNTYSDTYQHTFDHVMIPLQESLTLKDTVRI